MSLRPRKLSVSCIQTDQFRVFGVLGPPLVDNNGGGGTLKLCACNSICEGIVSLARKFSFSPSGASSELRLYKSSPTRLFYREKVPQVMLQCLLVFLSSAIVVSSRSHHHREPKTIEIISAEQLIPRLDGTIILDPPEKKDEPAQVSGETFDFFSSHPMKSKWKYNSRLVESCARRSDTLASIAVRSRTGRTCAMLKRSEFSHDLP